jgi:phosphoribosyl 1,2-cyclic phosphate phosphodiesterase
LTLRFLGTGTSHGVPVVACTCKVCSSDDPHDSRYRSSVVVEGDGGEVVLVDAGPEFRLQAIRAGLTRLDAILITHAHADHVHGLDDVRPLTRGKHVPVYASPDDVDELRERFSYAFRLGQEGGGKPRLELRAIDETGATIGSLHAMPVPILHGDRAVFGYRIKNFAYLTDCSAVPLPSLELLRGLDLLVVDALRNRPHPTHFSLEEAFALARELSPARLLLTHICHDLTHAEIQALCDAAGLPFPASPAYDGLELFID